ncbi:MAG: murein biosynthesis integral membrane protein MurJ [Burkholderiales bacterium]|nr:murein biosynthesis integral membrane protein MurJ [Burkholderiales bacterium]
MNLLGALAKVSGFTLASRITGLVREFLIARAFGASAYTDAFFVAFRLPNLLRRLFAEGAFSQAFVPILAETKHREGEAATRSLIDHAAGTLAAVLLAVSALGVAAAPLLIYVTAPGFAADADKFAVTVDMLRITFPYILFMGLTALAGAMLNTWGRFSVPAFTPVLLNLSFIACALWLAPHVDPPAMALAWAVLAGGILQLGLQCAALARLGLLPRPSVAFGHPGVRRILKGMAPALLGVSVAQVSLLLNTIIASFLESGSVSWLYYADRLMEFPTGMLGVALGTILLPSLAKAAADGDTARYSGLLDWGLRLTILLALPAAAALAVLATPLVSTLYHYGAFGAADVAATRAALHGYAVGLLGLILVKVLAPGFYARQDIATPVRYAIVALVATQAMNAAFVWPLGHAGLALAIGLAACLNALLLWRGLRARRIYVAAAGWPAFLAKVGAATLLMAAALLWLSPPEARWLALGGAPLIRVAHLAGLVAVGALAYFAALAVLGFRPAHFRRHDA